MDSCCLIARLGVHTLPFAGIGGLGFCLLTVPRGSAVAGALVWALLMQLLGVLPATESIRPFPLGIQFDACYIALLVVGGYLVILRRDIARQ